jgi:RNA polymerase sigma-32 factor
MKKKSLTKDRVPPKKNNPSKKTPTEKPSMAKKTVAVKPMAKMTLEKKKSLKPKVITPKEILPPEEDELGAAKALILSNDEKNPEAKDALQKYLSDMRKYPLLTPEEEHKLAVLYKETGDRKAAERLVTSNLRFVVKVAAEYSKFGARMIDLIQEGNVGLMHAVREFNPFKGVRLITYAVWWIRGYIQEYLMKNYSQVRIGTTQAQKKLFYHLNKEKAKLDSLGNAPDTKLLSSRLGVTESEIKQMESRLQGADLSLDAPQGDDDSARRWIDSEADTTTASVEETLALSEEKKIFNQEIGSVIKLLNEKEKYILAHRVLGDPPQTLQEVGDQFGITRERARQLEERVIEKIKEHFSKVFPDYKINLPEN